MADVFAPGEFITFVKQGGNLNPCPSCEERSDACPEPSEKAWGGNLMKVTHRASILQGFVGDKCQARMPDLQHYPLALSKSISFFN